VDDVEEGSSLVVSIGEWGTNNPIWHATGSTLWSHEDSYWIGLFSFDSKGKNSRSYLSNDIVLNDYVATRLFESCLDGFLGIACACL